MQLGEQLRGEAAVSRVAALTLLGRLEAVHAVLTGVEDAALAARTAGVPESREEAGAERERLCPLAQEALTRHPELLAQTTSTYVRDSAPLAALPAESLPALVPAVRALLTTTQALVPIRTVQTFLARAAPRQVVESGLATDAHPRVRRAVLQALCRSRVDGAVEVLHQLFTRPELTTVDRGLLLDRLEALGEDVSLLDSERTLSLEAWAELARAEGADAVPKDLRGLPLVTVLAPLGELPVRWLLTQAREMGEERLPRPFRHLLERHLPPQALPALGRHALESWLAVKGKTGAAWMLSLIAEYAGDESVTTICRQIDAWRRHQKPKANTAIRALGRMGTVFALSQLERIASAGGRYTESLVQNAHEGLAEAAAARGLTPEQLREELVPDLGLTPEGLVVDLGPRGLRVKVRTDLSLEVHHEGGKVTKSFPALRKDEDPVKHAEGKQRFDVLRKNLQPVLKAQLARLEEVLFVQDDYMLERWQRLFLRHPVLRLVLQPVIWCRLTPPGEVVGSFRVAEDGTLVDAQNAEVRLHPSERIGLWHPVLEDARTHALWEEHLMDYRLVQPFRQLQREALRPTGAEREATAITRFQGMSLWASRLRNNLERLGCRAPVGDGGMLHEHARALPNHGVAFRVLHSPIQRQFELEERVELGQLEYTLEPRYRQRHGLAQQGQPTLGELPPVLCACLLDVMRSLALQADTP
ncbi:Molybdate metabolism regulator [Archangium gephyra]|uniref:Molybdate metabolism regulator n=1 Tax=Archangium gephyra TaxID=48 RepID=A0AAC8Q471_9BACT|nr:Molybdate metabolism regulator [Archangium gephyra]